MRAADGRLRFHARRQPHEAGFLRRYRALHAGGAKLIWAEATAVLEEGRATPRQLQINEKTLPDLEKMLRICRQAHREACGTDDDLIVGLQLTHSGRYAHPKPLIAVHDPILDPRTIANKATGTKVDDSYHTLTDDYLKRLTDHYVAAAKRAYKAGYQFVDIKQCHRYLLSELLASRTRPGPYGGSLENRTRLARDIITAIRSEVPGLVIATRINVFDCIPYKKRSQETGDRSQDDGEPCPWQAPLACAWGTAADDPNQPDLTEPLEWIGTMLKLGVTTINITMGSPVCDATRDAAV